MSSPIGSNKIYRDGLDSISSSLNHDIKVTKERDTRIPPVSTLVVVDVIPQEIVIAQSIDDLENVNFDGEEEYAENYIRSLQKQLDNHSDRKNVSSIVDAILEQTQDPFDVFDQGNEIAEKTEKVFKFSRSEKATAVVGALDIFRTAVQGAQVTSLAVNLIIQSIQLQQASKLLSQMKKEMLNNPSDSLDKKIIITEELIRKIQTNIKSKAADFALSFTNVALKTLNYMADIIEKTIPHFSVGTGAFSSILGVVFASIEVHKSRKAKKIHEIWTKELSSDKRSVKQANDLLAQRQIRLIEKKIGSHSFENLKEELIGVGIDLNKYSLTDMQGFTNRIKMDDAFRNSIFKVFVTEKDEKEITIQALTRQGLEALAPAKVKNEKKFFDFKLITNSLGLSLATLSAALTITLEILAVVGVISLAATSIAMPILGLALLGVGLTVFGLIYFYRHRPNLFKCFIKGVNLRIHLFEIITKVRSLQLVSCERNYKKISQEIRIKKMQLNKLDKNDTNKVKAINQAIEKSLIEQRKLKKNRDFLEKKRSYWLSETNGKLTVLKRKITTAANKDFEIASRLRYDEKDDKGNSQRVPLIKIIAEGLIEGKGDFDKETYNVLKNKMGIDLDKIPKLAGRVSKEKLMLALANYFKMDESKLESFMKAQLEMKNGNNH